MPDLYRGQRESGHSRDIIEKHLDVQEAFVDRSYRLSNQWVDALNLADATLIAISPDGLAKALIENNVAELHAHRQHANHAARVATSLLTAAKSVEEACSIVIALEGKRHAEIAKQEQADRRQERMASRPEPAPEAPRPRCITCGKKPRSIDDYCKKCARAAGIVIHGKIGEA